LQAVRARWLSSAIAACCWARFAPFLYASLALGELLSFVRLLQTDVWPVRFSILRSTSYRSTSERVSRNAPRGSSSDSLGAHPQAEIVLLRQLRAVGHQIVLATTTTIETFAPSVQLATRKSREWLDAARGFPTTGIAYMRKKSSNSPPTNELRNRIAAPVANNATRTIVIGAMPISPKIPSTKPANPTSTCAPAAASPME
jgi:hypothetical protein